MEQITSLWKVLEELQKRLSEYKEIVYTPVIHVKGLKIRKIELRVYDKEIYKKLKEEFPWEIEGYKIHLKRGKEPFPEFLKSYLEKETS